MQNRRSPWCRKVSLLLSAVPCPHGSPPALPGHARAVPARGGRRRPQRPAFGARRSWATMSTRFAIRSASRAVTALSLILDASALEHEPRYCAGELLCARLRLSAPDFHAERFHAQNAACSAPDFLPSAVRRRPPRIGAPSTAGSGCTPSSHSENSLSKICSKGWVAHRLFFDR